MKYLVQESQSQSRVAAAIAEPGHHARLHHTYLSF